MPRSFRKSLCAPALLQEARRCFDELPDGVASRGITLSDCLMSGLAVFGLNYPSLLQFDQHNNETLIQASLTALLRRDASPLGHVCARAPGHRQSRSPA